jgi:hypothetical protein
MIFLYSKYKLTQFFRLNLIALKLNNTYKYNIYMLIVLFISIIASVILRSNVLYYLLLAPQMLHTLLKLSHC